MLTNIRMMLSVLTYIGQVYTIYGFKHTLKNCFVDVKFPVFPKVTFVSWSSSSRYLLTGPFDEWYSIAQNGWAFILTWVIVAQRPTQDMRLTYLTVNVRISLRHNGERMYSGVWHSKGPTLILNHVECWEDSGIGTFIILVKLCKSSVYC